MKFGPRSVSNHPPNFEVFRARVLAQTQLITNEMDFCCFMQSPMEMNVLYKTIV